MRRVAFRVPLTAAVGNVTERSGWLVEGSAGWGECSPLPSWSAAERAAAERAAIEAATEGFPTALRTTVEVNAMVPRMPPAEAAELAKASRCATIKIKVGDDDGAARVRAVLAAVPGARIRIDANGAWRDAEEADAALRAFEAFDLEYVEDPVPTLEELAVLRMRARMPLAAEASVRTIEDAMRLRALDAADVVVLKPQRMGGVRAALDAAYEAGVPAVASSALETSVGLAAVLALAAALPEAPFAAGAGTALLLARDVVHDPLIPKDGVLEVRRPAPDLSLVSA